METRLDWMANSVAERGFAVVEEVLDEIAVHDLSKALDLDTGSDSLVRMRGGTFAVRNLLSVVPQVAELAKSEAVRELVKQVLGTDYLAVRGILFDKIPEANWKVPWHQDVTIAVQSRVEVEGFGPWTTKAGVLHVQPPAWVLENMISVRIHLDTCGEDNGALRVIPGSHRDGRIPECDIPQYRDKLGEHTCAVGLGGALLMRPLLLHASSPSQIPGHRRVVHLDFASARLPNGMQWESAPMLSK